MSTETLAILSVACLMPVVLDILFIFDDSRNFISNVADVQKIRALLLTNILQCLAYVVDYIVLQLPNYHYYSFAVFTSTAVILSNLLFLFCYADYVCLRYAPKTYSTIKGRIIFTLPIILSAVVIIINVFHPIAFYVDPITFEYTETPVILILDLVVLIYIGFAAFGDIAKKRNGPVYVALPLSVFFLPTIIGEVVEAIHPDLPLVPASCGLSVTIMYLHVLKQIGYIDDMSGLYNRNQLSFGIDSMLSKLKKGESLSGMMLDIDRFRYINNTYGHNAGDRAIREAGALILKVAGKTGICFRSGEDDFVILLKTTNAQKELSALTDTLHEFESEFNAKKSDIFTLTFSHGSATYDPVNDSPITFVERMSEERTKDKLAR